MVNINFVSLCTMKQLGREEDGLWKDTVPEPHHTHHTMGEANQVHMYTSLVLAYLNLCRILKRIPMYLHFNFTLHTARKQI